MEDENLLKEVGKVSFEALSFARSLVKPGARKLDVADSLENFMRERGFGLAFPVNLSSNEEAAHSTPESGDKSVFGDEDLVKVDLGARKGDALGDCAITIDLSSEYGKLVEASEEALEAAISMVKSGLPVREIGKSVGEIAAKYGFNPIRNLGGHGIEKGDLHARIFIPNYDNGDSSVLEEGQTIAIETFITTGKGYVSDGDYVQIFRKLGPAQLRSQDSREVAGFIDENFSTYPFALRWLSSKFGSEFKVKAALNEMARIENIESFPVLIESSKGMVAQTEKEMIVEKDSCNVITK